MLLLPYCVFFIIGLIFIYLFDRAQSGSIGDALLLSGAEEKAA
jgi:fucose 4-O-acetylase-like acetyltransferase